MFGTVAAQWQDILMRFQASLASISITPGGIDFDSYRAFDNPERTGAGPHRFIDGELLERFLDLDEPTQERVCSGLGPTVETMRSLVEELKRMH
jgi:DNA damage-binding protein 1